MNDISKFIKDQLSVWPLSSKNFRALKQVSVKNIEVGGLECKVQYNPARKASTTAEIDPASIAARPCFLCIKNRPAEQFHLKFEGRKGRGYNIQVNPFPIFPNHLVIVRDQHLPQVIWHHLPDMLDFAMTYPEFMVYYNGPEAGASAPDHLHFQACPRKSLPLELEIDSFLDKEDTKEISKNKDAYLYHYQGFHRGIFCLKATTTKSLAKLFYRLLDCCDRNSGEVEPMFNLYAWTKGEEYRVMVCLRKALRSHHYYCEGQDHLMVTAGAAEMAGVIISPAKEDAAKIDARLTNELFDEVCIDASTEEMIIHRLTRNQQRLGVILASSEEIRFEIISDGAGPQTVKMLDGKICYNGVLYDELVFDAVTRSTLFPVPSFIIYDSNGQRQFAGQLRFLVENGKVLAINRIGLEHFIRSLMATQSSGSESLENLKKIAKEYRNAIICKIGNQDNSEFLQWNDYKGLPNKVEQSVNDAVDQTWGRLE